MIKTTKTILVCGSGGVGKTTLAASLGLKLALAGQKTVVLTIDPAKRLAASLGLEELNDAPRKIGLGPLKKTRGEMWAAMLDTKRTFDRLVEKYAPNKAAKERIFHNKLYQHMSRMLAGTQEYMAMERLYEIHSENRYDVIVVDTPPMQNAIDFLSAPQKMTNMIKNSMLHLLLKPTLSLGKTGFKLMKVFDRITGFAFMQDLSEMLMSFESLLEGFNLRAQEVNSLLRDENSQFFFVCTWHNRTLNEVRDFQEMISTQKFHLAKIIVNRVYCGETLAAKNSHELTKYFSAREANILLKNYQRFLPLIKRDKNHLTDLRQQTKGVEILTIPLFYTDVHHIKKLMDLTRYLDFSTDFS